MLLLSSYVTAQNRTYYNTRFGFYASYPSYLHDNGESFNHDGTTFLSSDETIKMTACAMFNFLEETTAEILHSERELLAEKGCEITYTFSNDTIVVLSGFTADGNIFYKKRVLCTMYSPSYEEMVDIVAMANVEYPQSARTKGDEIVKCLKRFPFK